MGGGGAVIESDGGCNNKVWTSFGSNEKQIRKIIASCHYQHFVALVYHHFFS
jgi:hypothetical protein